MDALPKGCSFTACEDRKIVKYLCERNAFDLVRGNKIWQLMEQAQICPHRSFHSLRNRFLRYISLRLHSDYSAMIAEHKPKLPPFLQRQRVIRPSAPPLLGKAPIRNPSVTPTKDVPYENFATNISSFSTPSPNTNTNQESSHPIADKDEWLQANSHVRNVPDKAPTTLTRDLAFDDDLEILLQDHVLDTQSTCYPSQQWENLRDKLLPKDSCGALPRLAQSKKTNEKPLNIPSHDPMSLNDDDVEVEEDLAHFSVDNRPLTTIAETLESSPLSCAINIEQQLHDVDDNMVLATPDVECRGTDVRLIEEDSPINPKRVDGLSQVSPVSTPDGITRAPTPSSVIYPELISATPNAQFDSSASSEKQSPVLSLKAPIRKRMRKKNSIPLASRKKLLRIIRIGSKLYHKNLRNKWYNEKLASIIGDLIISIKNSKEEQMAFVKLISGRDVKLRNFLTTYINSNHRN